MTRKFSARAREGGFPARARLIAAPVVLAAIGLLAACSAPGGSAAPRATVTVTAQPTQVVTAGTSGRSAAPAAPSASAPAAAPASTPAAPAPAAPPPPAPCLTRYLAANLGNAQGAAGSTYVELVFTNLDNVSCTLYGFPGVAMDAGVPVTPVGLPSSEDPATPRELVTLPPHGKAAALLRIASTGDYTPAACKPVNTQWLQVIPPNQYVPVYIGYNSQTCANAVQMLTVAAVQPIGEPLRF
jgi:hypothetical protein